MSIHREQIRAALSRVLVALAILLSGQELRGQADAGSAGAKAGVEDRADLAAWSRGAVRWLLLPAELRDLRQVSSPADESKFIERFWARRDPDPATPGNPYRDNFFKLVEAADLLYAENGVRGSLTDRGRALIVLGAPTGLRVSSREALEWAPGAGADDNVQVRHLPLEIWTYQAENLDRALRLALKAVTDETTFQVSFVRDAERMALSDGDELLELAVRTALALP